MYWRIMIVAPEGDFEDICNHFKELCPITRRTRYELHIDSGLLSIDIYPWHGEYHWRGHKADLIYIPDEAMENEEIRAKFQNNAILGAVKPLQQIKWRIGLK